MTRSRRNNSLRDWTDRLPCLPLPLPAQVDALERQILAMRACWPDGRPPRRECPRPSPARGAPETAAAARQRVALEERVAELTEECERLRVSYERALAFELGQAAAVTLAISKAASAAASGDTVHPRARLLWGDGDGGDKCGPARH